nr:smr domain-containing protein [Quercus suber]
MRPTVLRLPGSENCLDCPCRMGPVHLVTNPPGILKSRSTVSTESVRIRLDNHTDDCAVKNIESSRDEEKIPTPAFNGRPGLPITASRASNQPLAPEVSSHWPTPGAHNTTVCIQHYRPPVATQHGTSLPRTPPLCTIVPMSHTRTQLGGGAFNHGPSSASEQEYDRLRGLARKEQGQHQHFAAQSQAAYQRGDGGEAHRLSEQGKQHAAQADAYNKQASEYIFRENNAVGKVAGDTIDLHGQYVEEAEEILEQRIRYARQTGQTHLHVIVGKGNHSPGHIQKIKPRVEQVCQELGLQYRTEHNEGRMYIDLQGGAVQHAPGYDYASQHQPQHQAYGQPHYETAYPMGGYTGQQHGGSYAQAAGGYPGQQQQHGGMQYGGQQQQYPGRPQDQFQQEQQQQQDQGITCCGIKICVVIIGPSNENREMYEISCMTRISIYRRLRKQFQNFAALYSLAQRSEDCLLLAQWTRLSSHNPGSDTVCGWQSPILNMPRRKANELSCPNRVLESTQRVVRCDRSCLNQALLSACAVWNTRLKDYIAFSRRRRSRWSRQTDISFEHRPG